MAAAALVLRETSVEEIGADWNRREVLARYRRLREISKRHHHELLNFVSRGALLHQAQRLGLARGKTFILDDMDELSYAFDLAIHTAPPDRSRAIDRYARSARLDPQSDEALVLEAMRRARFSILAVERRHETAGLIAIDLVRRTEVWLVDIGLESCMPKGSVMATRLFAPERFSMTAGANVPFELEDMLPDVADLLPRLSCKPLHELIDDRRFAEAIYRAALAGGIMARVKYQDLPPA